MRKATYKNVQVRYDYCPSQQKTANNVVLLHSLGLALEEFDSLLPFFHASSNVLRYDMLGHGQHEQSSEPITADQLVKQLLYMTQLVFKEKFYIVAGPGLGYIATRFCREHPASVLGLVMVSPVPVYFSLDEQQQLVGQIALKLSEGFQAYKQFLLSHFTINQDASLVSHIEGLLNLTSEEVHFGLIQTCLTEDFASDFHHILIPILVLAGTQDTLFPSSVYGMAANNMRARFRMIPNAAHLVTVDNPEASADAVLDFIRNIESSVPIEYGFTVQKEEITNALYSGFDKNKGARDVLHVYLLHTFRVKIGDLEVTHGWNIRKVKSIFLYLLFHGTVSRNEMIEVFWPDIPMNNARNQLRMNLYFLKSLLKHGETELLHKDREHIFLQHNVQCDAIAYVIQLRKVYNQMLYGDLELQEAQLILEISPTKLFSHVYDEWYLEMSNLIEKQFIALCHWTAERLNDMQREKDAAVYEQMIEKLNEN
ncbi:MAG: alpha/beta hydrolase fold protein [Paenibacillus sp.]|nr:alpha/beta hydrolase fold protein [Paenibacillus sp.]